MGPNWSRLLNRDLDTLSDSVILVENSMERFDRMIGVVARASNSLSGIVQGLNSNFSGLGVTQTSLLNTYEKYIQTFDKLNRSAMAYGNSSQVIEKRISNLTKVTNLSNKELTELTSMIDSKLLGVRNYSNIDGMIKRVNDLGKTAEETKRMLDSLAQTQSKYGTGFGSFYSITGQEMAGMDRQSFNDLLQTNFMEPGQIQNRQREQLGRFQGARTRYEELELTAGRGITPFALGAAEGISNFSQNYLGIDGAGALAGAGAIGTAAVGVVAAEWYRALFGGRGSGGRSAGSGGMLGGGGGMPQMFGPGIGGFGGSSPVHVTNFPPGLSAGLGSRFGPMANGPQYFGPGGAPMGTGMSTTMSGRLGGGVRMMLGRGLMGLGGSAAIGLGGYALSQSLESGYLDKLFPNNERGGTAKATVAGGIQGAMQGGMVGAGTGAMFGPAGMLVGGAAGLLIGSMMGASSAHKQAQDRQKQLDNTDKLVDIQKEINKELMEENINQDKINSLVKKHNELVGDTGQHLNTNVVVLQGMFDQMQGFIRLQERMSGMFEDQIRSLQSMANFYGEISFEGEKAEASAIKAAEKQIKLIDQQEASWIKIRNLRDEIRAKGAQNSAAEIEEANKLTESYEKQFGIKFDDIETEQKILEFTNKRLEANRNLQTAQLKQEETATNLQGVYTQQAESFENLVRLAKVGIGSEVGAILNTARQYTRELTLQQDQMMTLNRLLSDTNAEYQKIQQDQSLTASTKAEKLEANRTKEASLRIDIERKQVDVLNSQSKILEKLLTLRERYVSALPEIGFSSFDYEVSFDVTRDTGLALFGAQNQFVGGRGGGGLRYTSGGVSPLGGQTGFAGPNAYGMFGPNNMTLGQGSSLGSAGAAQQAALQGYSSGGIVKRGQLRGPTGGWLAELHDTDAAVLTEQHLNKLGLTEQDLMSIGVPAFKGNNSSGTSVPAFDGGAYWGSSLSFSDPWESFGLGNPIFDLGSMPFRSLGTLGIGLMKGAGYATSTVGTFAANRVLGPKARVGGDSFLYPWQKQAINEKARGQSIMHNIAKERNMQRRASRKDDWWRVKSDAEVRYGLTLGDDGIDRNRPAPVTPNPYADALKKIDLIAQLGQKYAAGDKGAYNPKYMKGFSGSDALGILKALKPEDANAAFRRGDSGLSFVKDSNGGGLFLTSNSGQTDISGNVNIQLGFDQSGNLVVKNMQKQFVQNMRGSTNRSAGSPHAASVSGAPI